MEKKLCGGLGWKEGYIGLQMLMGSSIVHILSIVPNLKTFKDIYFICMLCIHVPTHMHVQHMHAWDLWR